MADPTTSLLDNDNDDDNNKNAGATALRTSPGNTTALSSPPPALMALPAGAAGPTVSAAREAVNIRYDYPGSVEDGQQSIDGGGGGGGNSSVVTPTDYQVMTESCDWCLVDLSFGAGDTGGSGFEDDAPMQIAYEDSIVAIEKTVAPPEEEAAVAESGKVEEGESSSSGRRTPGGAAATKEGGKPTFSFPGSCVLRGRKGSNRKASVGTRMA